VALAHERLADAEEAERMKAFWRDRVAALKRRWSDEQTLPAAAEEPSRTQTNIAVRQGAIVPTTKERGIMDWKLELVAIPVSDVDRAKTFYTEKAGFNADHDHRVSDEIRFVQLTPPGSACSIALGTGIVDTPPGSVQGMQLVVSDIHAARAELAERGVEVSEVQKFDWGSFVFFSDPDGNGWSVQQLPARD
jgi:predicted enzyme related to lactoylglutathione lyase